MIIENDVLNISHSSLATLDSCMRKFEFSKLRGVNRRNRDIPPEVGNCLHAGFQKYVETGNSELAIWEMMRKYPIDLNSNPTHPRSLEACYATLNAMFNSQSLQDYEIAQIECLDGAIRPAIEVPFIITIKNFELVNGRNVTIQYRGFIDIILFSKITGEYTIFEIKTHRDNSNDLSAKYRFNEQPIPYAILLERVLNNPITSLAVKYISVYIDIVAPKIRTYTFEKSEVDVRDWAQGLHWRLLQIKQALELDWFPRNANTCIAWNKVCRYFDICQSRQTSVIEKSLELENSKAITNRQADERENALNNAWIRMDLELGANSNG